MEDNENLKEYMLKEIDIIQGIINRMAHNSFMIKGWAITLVVVALLLQGTKYQVLLAFIPLLVFWFLDAYFLWQERMYRKLYDWVAAYGSSLFLTENELREYSSGRDNKKMMVFVLGRITRYQEPKHLGHGITMVGEYISEEEYDALVGDSD